MGGDKNILKKIQNDIKKSNPKIVNSSDDLSNIKRNLGSKFTEDLSDSEDDLSSYKLRNRDVINQMKSKPKPKPKPQPQPQPQQSENIKVKPIKHTMTIGEEINEMAKEINNSTSTKESKKNKKSEDSESESGSESGSEKSEKSETSDDSEGSEPEYEYTVELAEKVKMYVKNDDRIRELQTELRKLNAEKKAAEMDILKHLERLGESNINITGGKLRINQYESKGSLAEDIVREAICEKIKDPSIIEKIFDKINEKRVANAKIQVSLKRTFERGKK
jgi:hypothetical protein